MSEVKTKNGEGGSTMMKSCKYIAENGECLRLKGVKKRYLEKPYYCGVKHWKSCRVYEKKEAKHE